MKTPQELVLLDILENESVLEFFLNYMADAERTVELTREIFLKDYFNEKYAERFDQHNRDELNHAEWIDALLKDLGLKQYPMEDGFQLIASFKRLLFDQLEIKSKNLTSPQLRLLGAYFYCAEIAAFQSFSEIRNAWKKSDSPRAPAAVELFDKILIDERQHVKFAWDLVMDHSESEEQAREVIAQMTSPYKAINLTQQSKLLGALRSRVPKSASFKLKILWQGACSFTDALSAGGEAKARTQLAALK